MPHDYYGSAREERTANGTEMAENHKCGECSTIKLVALNWSSTFPTKEEKNAFWCSVALLLGQMKQRAMRRADRRNLKALVCGDFLKGAAWIQTALFCPSQLPLHKLRKM